MAKKKEETEEKEETLEVEEIEEVKSSDDDEEEEYVELTTEERILNIEKKTNLLLALVFCVLAFSLITMILVINNGSSGSSKTTEETTSEKSATSNGYDTSAFKEISAQDIASESKKETIVVMIGRQGCGYCAQFAPILTAVAEQYGVTVRYIDFLKLVDLQKQAIIDEEGYNIIKNLSASKDFEGAGEQALQGTPATLFIKNNKIVYYIRGAADASTTANAFDIAGLGK